MRVVSTKLEYTTSLGQVLSWGATWAPLEWIPMVGKRYMRWGVPVMRGALVCEPVMRGAQGGGAVVARKMETLMKTFWLGQFLRTY